MPVNFTLPPDTRAVGTGNPPADMNGVVDCLTAIGAAGNVLNGAWGAADPTGVADSKAAFAAALAAAGGGGRVLVPPGTFALSGSVHAPSSGSVQILGSGWGATILRPTAGFVADSSGAVISVDGPHTEIGNLQIQGGPSATFSSNPAANAIEVQQAAQYADLHDLAFYYVNGWCIEAPGDVAGNTIGSMISRLHNFQSKNGVHLKGTGAGNFNGQWQLTDVQAGQIAGDSIFLEDIQDVSIKGHNDSVTGASGGSALHIKGHCSAIFLINADLGVFPGTGTAPVILIEDYTRTFGTASVNGTTTLADSGNSFTAADVGRTVGTANVATATTIVSITDAGHAVMSAAATGTSGPQSCTLSSSPNRIEIGPGMVQQGLYGIQVTGGADQINFSRLHIVNNQQHGALIQGTGIQFAGSSILGGTSGSMIHFDQCTFNVNNQAGAASIYDVEWTGAVTGTLTRCKFVTAVGAAAAGVVANPMDFTGAGNVTVENCNAMGGGTTSTNVFNTAPKWARNTIPWNPHGAVAISVPATTVASASRSFDMMFYITAGASTCTCVVSPGGPSIVIPSGGFGTVYVPAGQTLTPTYTSAPTWVVFGN